MFGVEIGGVRSRSDEEDDYGDGDVVMMMMIILIISNEGNSESFLVRLPICWCARLCVHPVQHCVVFLQPRRMHCQSGQTGSQEV